MRAPIPPAVPPSEERVNVAVAASIGRPRTVLDLGCGAGLHGSIAKQRGARVTGVEPRAERAVAARRLLDEVIEVAPDDPVALDRALGDRTFDLVLVADALGNAADPASFLAWCAGRVAEGGRLVVSTRNERAWTARLGASSLEPANDRAGARRFRREDVAAWLSGAGLELLVVEHNPTLATAARATLDAASYLSIKEGARATGFYDLPVYEAYLALVRPIEEMVCDVAPELLSLDHVFVARRRPRPGKLSLTVGMLTMDEEPSIARMMGEIRKHAPDAEVVVVDSSLKDRTPLIAEELGARVLRQLPPRGHGPAMELLMYEAAARTDALVYLDCDFTYPPEVIPAIRRLLEEGADVVNATRTRVKPEHMPLPNFLANRAFALTARAMHGVPTSDLHSGMRGYRSSLVRSFAFDGEGDAIPIDTLLWPAKCGYEVVEIPIDYQERVGYSKLRKLAGTVWTFIRLAKTLRVGDRGGRHFDARASDRG